MATYYARLSALGRAAVAAAMAGGPALAISHLAIGDSGGAVYNPTGDELALAGERARVVVETVSRPGDAPDTLVVTATFPAATGGFWAREAAIYMAGGVLLAIARIPEAYKPTVVEGGSFDYVLTVKIRVSATAPVTIVEMASDSWATLDYVRARQAFFAVKGMTSTAPPGGPGVGDTYLIPAAPTGAWAGRSDQLAYWRGAAEGWLFWTPPKGSVACAELTGRMMRFTAAGWRTVTATSAEMIAGDDGDILVSPSGVRTSIEARRHAMAVDSANTTAPPGGPATRAAYLIPAGATGAWAGKTGQVAVWDGTAWIYYDLVVGSLAIATDSGLMWVRRPAAWRTYTATLAEHLAGTAADLLATPAGVVGAIESTRATLVVASATTTAPPGAPAARAAYIIPAAATGVWAGRTGKVAVWDGTAWLYFTMVNGTLAIAADTGLILRLVGGSWRGQAATLAEHLAGTAADLFATPAGVVGMFETTRASLVVASATTTAPPGAPAARASYIIPAAATGVWAGKTAQVAVWDGTAWAYYTMPNGTLAIAADTGLMLRLAAGTWRGQGATTAEAIAGVATDLFTTPQGLAAAIETVRATVVVASATTTAPPGAPVARVSYLVAAAATGAWAGKDGQVAVWSGAAWLFYAMPNGTRAFAADTGVCWKLVAGVWRTDVATLAEHLAGVSVVDLCNPAGVKAMIDTALAAYVGDIAEPFFQGMF